ncbi:hypothetical protein EDC55_1303 [Allofrancisella inopinata]|uniref:hypothetical protein n=1 Tax=Allofrancisella inopinata TaxID=1085647 RepID=UPI0010DC2736|nr:hypothetical protein [Allofrancisella inopinata]TDT66937.1 hypothetical protein EDC55_1303 [Allofrancisella inopinata]
MNAKQKAKNKYQRFLIEECGQNRLDVVNSNISIKDLKNISKIFKMLAKERN